MNVSIFSRFIRHKKDAAFIYQLAKFLAGSFELYLTTVHRSRGAKITNSEILGGE